MIIRSEETIDTHKGTAINDLLSIHKVATTHYRVVATSEPEEDGFITCSILGDLHFQNDNPLPNGITDEVLLAILIDRLEGLNAETALLQLVLDRLKEDAE